MSMHEPKFNCDTVLIWRAVISWFLEKRLKQVSGLDTNQALCDGYKDMVAVAQGVQRVAS